MKRKPLLISLAIASSVIAAVCYIPLPHHIDAAFEIRPSRAGAVYAGTVGRLADAVDVGTRVEAGEPIATLINPELEIRMADLRGEEQVADVQLTNLQIRSRDDVAVVAQIETQEELLESIRSMIEKTSEELDRLVVRAKQTGFVLPPPERPSRDSGDGQLPGWTGTPLQKKNRGALLTADDLICEIGTPDAFEAVLIIDQGDRQLVREQQDVELKLDSFRIATFEGVVEEISKNPMRAASASMSSQTGGDLQTEIDPETGQVKPRSVSYQARVPIAVEDLPMLRPGYRGTAKVHVDPMSLGQRLWRVIIKTFNFEF